MNGHARAATASASIRLHLCLVLAAVLAFFAADSARAQPFGAWAKFTGQPTHGFIEISHSPALNPTGALTIEAWISVSNNVSGEDCRTILGKNYLQAWWIGICNVGGQPTLRSYLKGGASARNGGTITRNVWTHIAVVFDGDRRKHYINGELALDVAETGPLTTSISPMRIGSDVSWQFTPAGNIDEVRLWNVARTLAQIRASLNVAITSPQPGLVSLWRLDGNLLDSIGGHNGVIGGAGVSAQTFPVAPNCGATTATTLCLQNRFSIRTFWRTNPVPGSATDGQAKVVGADSGSGIFWFFAASNWEVMVKALNGCGLNDRHWIFSAATTNVFYRMEVLDVTAGVQKIYFNYPGPPAPAVTDTSAFATCP
jgi:hypothetical protein